MKYYFSLWREEKIICKKDDMYVFSTNQKENTIYTLVNPNWKTIFLLCNVKYIVFFLKLWRNKYFPMSTVENT